MKPIFKFSLVVIIALGIVSCKGKSGERIIKGVEDAVEHYHPKPGPRTLDHVKDAYEYITDDNEPQYQPQATIVLCGQCGGTGAVYMLDAYGNYMTDYYGNPVVGPCGACGGTGQQVVYQ